MRSELEAVILAIVVLGRKMCQLCDISDSVRVVEYIWDYPRITWRERRS